MEWAYYQQYNSFQTSFSSIGFSVPNSAFWSYGITSANAQSAVLQAAGTNGTPVGGQFVSLVISSDGSALSGATF